MKIYSITKLKEVMPGIFKRLMLPAWVLMNSVLLDPCVSDAREQYSYDLIFPFRPLPQVTVSGLWQTPSPGRSLLLYKDNSRTFSSPKVWRIDQSPAVPELRLWPGELTIMTGRQIAVGGQVGNVAYDLLQCWNGGTRCAHLVSKDTDTAPVAWNGCAVSDEFQRMICGLSATSLDLIPKQAYADVPEIPADRIEQANILIRACRSFSEFHCAGDKLGHNPKTEVDFFLRNVFVEFELTISVAINTVLGHPLRNAEVVLAWNDVEPVARGPQWKRVGKTDTVGSIQKVRVTHLDVPLLCNHNCNRQENLFPTKGYTLITCTDNAPALCASVSPTLNRYRQGRISGTLVVTRDCRSYAAAANNICRARDEFPDSAHLSFSPNRRRALCDDCNDLLKATGERELNE